MQYTIRHVTNFTYEASISESVMEARMQPRSEGLQQCIRFGLSTTPPSHVRMYQDAEGNIVHHFNVQGRHSRLTVTAEAFVDCRSAQDVPEALACGAWEQLDAATAAGEFWDVLNPSPFARRTDLLCRLAEEMRLARGKDPLTTVRQVMAEIFSRFEYSPNSTRVDSPIDHALSTRQGVCQDFAHIMIALVRQLGVPCRYVSGYLFEPASQANERAHLPPSFAGATHAWVEAWLLDLGWVGFDPTHNCLAAEHHVRVAVGRDYADVPPTRGVFKGLSSVRSELTVGVSVGANASPASEPTHFTPWMSREASSPLADSDHHQQQQLLLQQQQQ